MKPLILALLTLTACVTPGCPIDDVGGYERCEARRT